MVLCATLDCPEGGVIQTSENYTCLFCSRVVDTLIYGEEIQVKSNYDIQSDATFKSSKKSEGERIAEKFCEKNHFSDTVFEDIKTHEKHLTIFSNKKNSRVRFALATITILNKHDIFVDSSYIAKVFRVLYSSLEKDSNLIKSSNSDESVKNLLQIFAHNFDLNYKTGLDIYQNIMEDVTFSSGMNPLVKISVFACISLSSKKNLSIHKATSIVSEYFHISRNTILKHVKKYMSQKK